MGNPFTGITVSGYNSNPPSDDGSQTEANRVKWATIKEKLPDPLKDAIEELNTNVGAAIDRLSGGVVSVAANYTVGDDDQGKLVKTGTAGITITTPDATDVDDPFRFFVLNLSTGDITLDGNGSQTIDGVASITIPSGGGVEVETDGTNWETHGQNFARTQVFPQGYLTLVSDTPIITSDQASKTSVYYTPFVGNLLPIPDGNKFNVREFSERTLALVSNHVASGIYDVFAALDPADNSTIIIGTGPVWNTVTAGSGARGTGAGTSELQKLKGLWCNKVAITLRNGSTTYSIGALSAIFLGSIAIDGTAGQVTCHRSVGTSRKWGVSNAYNKQMVELVLVDSNSGWTYSTGTTRQSRNQAANVVTPFCCLPDESIFCTFAQHLSTAGTQAQITAFIGIGVNQTSDNNGMRGYMSIKGDSGVNASVAADATPTARHTVLPAIGINNINAVENGATGFTFNGGESHMRLTAQWRA